MEVEQQIKEIWAIIRAGEERAKQHEDRAEQMELRFDKRTEEFERRMELAERKAEAEHRAMIARMDKAEARMDKAEARMEKFDRRLEATHKLVMAGMQMLAKRDAETKAMKQEIRELVKAQKAYLDSMRRGNGNGRRRVN